MASKHKSLTIEDVSALGAALIELADMYPLTFLTETDFFPLVIAYLHGRVPAVKTEVATKKGDIDFRIGGTNPAVLELAVAPRRLMDPDCNVQVFSGHQATTQLYAKQNLRELAKLKDVPQNQAKNRYLLLLDVRGYHDFASLKTLYLKELPRGSGGSPVRVFHAKRGEPPKSFLVGGK